MSDQHDPDQPSVESVHDAESLVTMLDSVKPQLLGYIEKHLGPALRTKLEPEDILQEVLVTAVAAPQHFAVPGRDSFRLLCQMAEQRIIDAHRHHVTAEKRSLKREVSGNQGGGNDSEDRQFLDLLVASMTSASGAFSREQREFRLKQALKKLGEEQQTALRLRYVEGMATRDVAEALGKTDGAVRVMLSRTISELQNYLRESG